MWKSGASGMMTRATVKAGLVALSLVATLGSWAALARNDGQPAPPAPELVVQTLDLPPIPTLARPSVAGEPIIPDIAASSTRDLPPIPMIDTLAPRPDPIARTRSSR